MKDQYLLNLTFRTEFMKDQYLINLTFSTKFMKDQYLINLTFSTKFMKDQYLINLTFSTKFMRDHIIITITLTVIKVPTFFLLFSQQHQFQLSFIFSIICHTSNSRVSGVPKGHMPMVHGSHISMFSSQFSSIMYLV